MDVLVGPTFTIDVSSPPYVPPQDNHAVACLFLKESGVGSGIGVSGPQKTQDLSDSSSSIGAPDDSEDDDCEEVQSKLNGGGGGGLGSLDSLEDSLPIKRGLSNYFSGKSKSFASLSEASCVSSVKEVEKRDNPFNKRRRVLIASKWSRKSSSFYNWPNPKSMPLLALNEEGDDEEEQEQEHEHDEHPSDLSSSDEKEQLQGRSTPKMLRRRLKSFKTRSCYCLSDLQDHKQQLG